MAVPVISRSSRATSGKGCAPAWRSATSSRRQSQQCLEATKAVNGGAGVLYLYGNYGGDVFNFDLAADLAELEDIETADRVGRRRRRRPAQRRPP